MQVRNSLQNKKQQNPKPKKSNPYNAPLKQKKKRKTIRLDKTQKSKSKSKSFQKSRSKSHHQKQNIRNKQIFSRSKGKDKSRDGKCHVSPIKIKIGEVKGYNTSPILKTDRENRIKVSPIKGVDRYAKNPLSQRDYQLACQTISTKLNTQRTPIKKASEKKQKTQTCKKSKKTSKQQKTNKTTQQSTKIKKKQKQITQLKLDTVKQQLGFKKVKKFVPEINTRGPQRKQSYFDSNIIEKLNLDNAQFFRRKRHHFQQISDQRIKKNNVSTQIQTHNSVEYRQFGIQTDPSQVLINQPLTYRDLQSFRKQQQLKWKIVYLELSQLKNTRTPQKIQQLIQSSHKNISQFQTKCKQITSLDTKSNKQYIFESPLKVKHALRRKRKSQQQNRSLIKTLSDQRLLQQLENLDNFQQLSQVKNNSKQQKASSSSFCIEFQKQLQSYSQENSVGQKNNQFNSVEVNHIPELQYQKSVVLLSAVQELLIFEFCQQLVSSSVILHSYLSCIKQKSIQNEQLVPCLNNLSYPQLKIKCNDTFSIDLLYKLYNFIQQNQYSHLILKRTNKTLSNTVQEDLKLLRQYYIQNQQGELQEEENQNNVSIIIDSDILGQFQNFNYEETIQGQYFYNHCVYSCFNQILDTFRPSYANGPPTLQTSLPTVHKSLSALFSKTLTKFQQILKVKMGRTNFGQQELDLIRITQNSYGLMDNFLVLQQQQKWRRISENIFQQKFFLAESIITDIFNEEIMMIYNEFV